MSLIFPVQIEPPCNGILSWKHYTKPASTTFNSWSVNFNKVKDNTSLYVMYTGMMGQYTNLAARWACLRISILFNNTQCSSPSRIASGSALYKNYGSTLYTFSSSAVSGECTGLPSGSTAVTVKAENACDTSSSSYHHGYNAGMGHSTTYSLHVEELCPWSKHGCSWP